MKNTDKLILKLTEDEAAAVRVALLITAVSFTKSESAAEREAAASMDAIRVRLSRSIRRTFPAME